MNHDATPKPAKRRNHRALLALYAAAGLGAVGLYLAYRVYVHHASFAATEFFFLGSIHQADPSVGFRMAPRRTGMAVLAGGVADPRRRIPVHTDQFGFRIPMARDSTTLSRRGLAAIGCSCTFGHGVAAESTWVARAEDFLGIPAYNLGVCAYSSVNSVELLRQHMGELDPALVVYAFGNFHRERSRHPSVDNIVATTFLSLEHRQARRAPPRFDNGLVYRLAPQIEREYYEPKLRAESVGFAADKLRLLLPLAWQDLARTLHPARWRPVPALDDTSLARWVIQELGDMARPHAAQVVLLFFPAIYGEAPDPGWLLAVQERQDGSSPLFVDCGPALFAQVRNREEYERRFQVPRDGHPNARMHAEMGRVLAAALGGGGRTTAGTPLPGP